MKIKASNQYTRTHLLRMLGAKIGARKVDLARVLGITPQAVDNMGEEVPNEWHEKLVEFLKELK